MAMPSVRLMRTNECVQYASSLFFSPKKRGPSQRRRKSPGLLPPLLDEVEPMRPFFSPVEQQ